MRLRYSILRGVLRALFSSCFQWRVLHADRVPSEGPVILAANHASYIDPPLIGAAALREIHFLARETLFTNPPMGALLRACNAVPVDRDGISPTGLKTILQRLHNGCGILLFPEGTRTSDGTTGSARPGVGLVAVRSEAPLLPVRVFGTFESFGRHLMLPRPRPLTVKFGRPLDLESFRAEARSCSRARLKEIYREAATAVMEGIAALTPFEDCDRFPPVRPATTPRR